MQDSGVSDGPGIDVTLPDYRTAVLEDGPIAYWRLDDMTLTARDEIGAHDGTFGGGCTLHVPGLLGDPNDTAGYFDGANCNVDLGDNFAFTGSAPFTIEAWISNDVGSSQFQHVFTHETRNGGPVDGYALVVRSNPRSAFIERVRATQIQSTGSAPIALSTTVYLVASFDGSNQHIYIDGTERSSVPDAALQNVFAAHAFIGAGPDPIDLTINHFQGVIDEVAIYDHALAAGRVALHFAAGKAAPHD